MPLFCLDCKRLLVFSCLVCIVSAMSSVTSSSAYADTSWSEILKPLVKDVIVPGASAGMKKLIEKKMKVKLDNSSGSSSNYSHDNVTTMHEEPSSTASSDQSGLISMPEEPTYSASSDNQGNNLGSLSAPPPPVEAP